MPLTEEGMKVWEIQACPQCGAGKEHIHYGICNGEYQLFKCDCNYVLIRDLESRDAAMNEVIANALRA